MSRCLLMLALFTIVSHRITYASESPAVTLEVRESDGSVVLKREVLIQPEDADLTPTQLLQRSERDTKAVRHWSLYWQGVIYRWDPRTAAHREFFHGCVDGPRCTIHVRDLVTGDIIVLRPEAY